MQQQMATNKQQMWQGQQQQPNNQWNNNNGGSKKKKKKKGAKSGGNNQASWNGGGAKNTRWDRNAFPPNVRCNDTAWYCWSHGYDKDHNRGKCKGKCMGHQDSACSHLVTAQFTFQLTAPLLLHSLPQPTQTSPHSTKPSPRSH